MLAAFTNPRRLQVVELKCLRVATNERFVLVRTKLSWIWVFNFRRYHQSTNGIFQLKVTWCNLQRVNVAKWKEWKVPRNVRVTWQRFCVILLSCKASSRIQITDGLRCINLRAKPRSHRPSSYATEPLPFPTSDISPIKFYSPQGDVLRIIAEAFNDHVFKCWLMPNCWLDAGLLASMPDCWLEISIRKVLRLATSTQVFLGFPVSTSECWDGSQISKLLLHASHVALPT